MKPDLSIIIPTYNEKETVLRCIAAIQAQANNVEIIVADSPASTTHIQDTLTQSSCTYFVCQKEGRNHQMNEGAAKASADILYFVHADTTIHPEFQKDILNCVANSYDLGCYAYRFDQYPNPLLYINAAFTMLPMIWCRGGDQTLFIKKTAFDDLGGFCKKHVIMEDYDILQRAEKRGLNFKFIRKKVTVSARKYEKNGYFKVQMANLKVMRKWLKGESSPQELFEFYKKTLS